MPSRPDRWEKFIRLPDPVRLAVGAGADLVLLIPLPRDVRPAPLPEARVFLPAAAPGSTILIIPSSFHSSANTRCGRFLPEPFERQQESGNANQDWGAIPCPTGSPGRRGP